MSIYGQLCSICRQYGIGLCQIHSQSIRNAQQRYYQQPCNPNGYNSEEGIIIEGECEDITGKQALFELEGK